MLQRDINLNSLVRSGKVLVIYGPRRTGKTTILRNYLNNCGLKYKLDSGDDIRTASILGSRNFESILEYAAGYDLIAIDEAQQIKNIGMGLKIIVDNIPNIKVIATGSSSFDIKQNIGEPLTGRKREITLYPFSQKEMLAKYNKFELREKLNDFLVFGSYPDAALAETRNEKIEILVELVNSYLLKDILALENLRASKQLVDLLKLLAFQVGSEVSLNELATQVSLDVKTVQKYLDILEKSFVIKRLTSFSRNLRKEVSTKSKYFFVDNGIRNGIILSFNKIVDRDDKGKLFENFLMIERIKKNSNNRLHYNSYFWRTIDKKEIDLIEDKDASLNGYEFKFSPGKQYKIPKAWMEAYPNSPVEIVTSENYLEFLL